MFDRAAITLSIGPHSSFWATVCKTVRPMLSVRCQSVCLSCPVCDVGVLWPNGWTDQDETWHAGRPRPWPHCVRWGPSSPSPKGHSPPIFGPYLLRPNGCMDQDATRRGARPRPRRLLWPNGWMDQDGTWHGYWPQSRRLCVGWRPSHPPPKGAEPPPQFSAHFCCGQMAGCIKMPLGMEVGLSPGEEPAP